jgi:hypothetical protein
MSEPSDEVRRLREVNKALIDASGSTALRVEVVVTEDAGATNMRVIVTDPSGNETREMLVASCVASMMTVLGAAVKSTGSRFERS